MSAITSFPATAHRLIATRPRSTVLVDMAIAATVFTGSLAQLGHTRAGVPGFSSHEITLASVGLVAWATLPVVASRRFPFGVFVVTATASATMAGLGYSLELLLGPTVALYLLIAGRERDTPWTRLTLITVVGLLLLYLGLTAVVQGTFARNELFHNTLAWAVAWFAGERSRLGREQIAELRERAVIAERAAEGERLFAAAEERARIARDLHDSAGHAINVIAVRAGAARLHHHQNPARSLQALEVIELVARQMAGEIDQIVGTLRADSLEREVVAAPLGLASLDALIAHHSSGGLNITRASHGTPRSVSRAADQAAYRIMQEALANAARHGSGSVHIELAFGETAVDISVTNAVPERREPRASGGHGLIGMRERTTLLGGTFDVERSDETFRVHASIPNNGYRS